MNDKKLEYNRAVQIDAVYDPAHRYACQIYFKQRLFHMAFPAVVSFNNGGRKGDSLWAWDFQGYISGCSCQITAVMTAAVASLLFIVLVTGLGQPVCFCFQ